MYHIQETLVQKLLLKSANTAGNEGYRIMITREENYK